MSELKKYFMNLVEPSVLAFIVGILAACIILTMMFSQRGKEFKTKYKITFYIYVFSLAFIYSVIAFLGFNKLFSDHKLYEFIFYQISSLILGMIHCWFYRVYFNRFGDKNKITEYLFVLLSVLYTMIPFALFYTLLNGASYLFLMLGHYILFIIPTLFNDTFNRAMGIPPRVYKTWPFPENYRELVGVQDEEMRDLVVFSFIIDRTKDAKKYSVYRAKGPTRIDFGRLFYNFILDYNERHTEAPIDIEGENGFYEWVFFLQPKWYETTKYIDPELTLYMNGIEENSVVFCVRSEKMMSQDEEKEDFEYDSLSIK